RQVHPGKISSEAGEALIIPVRITPVHHQVLALGIAKAVHALQEGIGKCIAARRDWARAWSQKANAPNFAPRLRGRPYRPCGNTADKSDQFPSPHIRSLTVNKVMVAAKRDALTGVEGCP